MFCFHLIYKSVKHCCEAEPHAMKKCWLLLFGFPQGSVEISSLMLPKLLDRLWFDIQCLNTFQCQVEHQYCLLNANEQKSLTMTSHSPSEGCFDACANLHSLTPTVSSMNKWIGSLWPKDHKDSTVMHGRHSSVGLTVLWTQTSCLSQTLSARTVSRTPAGSVPSVCNSYSRVVWITYNNLLMCRGVGG